MLITWKQHFGQEKNGVPGHIFFQQARIMETAGIIPLAILIKRVFASRSCKGQRHETGQMEGAA